MVAVEGLTLARFGSTPIGLTGDHGTSRVISRQLSAHQRRWFRTLVCRWSRSPPACHRHRRACGPVGLLGLPPVGGRALRLEPRLHKPAGLRVPRNHFEAPTAYLDGPRSEASKTQRERVCSAPRSLIEGSSIPPAQHRGPMSPRCGAHDPSSDPGLGESRRAAQRLRRKVRHSREKRRARLLDARKAAAAITNNMEMASNARKTLSRGLE